MRAQLPEVTLLIGERARVQNQVAGLTASSPKPPLCHFYLGEEFSISLQETLFELWLRYFGSFE